MALGDALIGDRLSGSQIRLAIRDDNLKRVDEHHWGRHPRAV